MRNRQAEVSKLLCYAASALAAAFPIASLFSTAANASVTFGSATVSAGAQASQSSTNADNFQQTYTAPPVVTGPIVNSATYVTANGGAGAQSTAQATLNTDQGDFTHSGSTQVLASTPGYTYTALSYGGLVYDFTVDTTSLFSLLITATGDGTQGFYIHNSGDPIPASYTFLPSGVFSTSYSIGPGNYEFSYFDNLRTQTSSGPANGSISDSLHYAISDVASVPEPATWGMMLLGFGAIGTAMRLRRQPMPQLA